MYARVVFAFSLLLIYSDPADACSCFPTSLEDQWEKSEYVFTARIDHVESRMGDYYTEEHAQFTVMEKLKGEPEQLSKLVAPRTSCGVPIAEGDKWVIATGKSGGISFCGVSGVLDVVDHRGRSRLRGEVTLEYFRAWKIDDQSACTFSQVAQVDELVQLLQFEQEVALGWSVTGADMKNRRAFLQKDDAELEIEIGGCNSLTRSLEMRTADEKARSSHSVFSETVSLVQTFWPESSAEEVAMLIDTEQYACSQEDEILHCVLFHPSATIEVEYGADRDRRAENRIYAMNNAGMSAFDETSYLEDADNLDTMSEAVTA